MFRLERSDVRMMARRLEGLALLLDTGDENSRQLADQIRAEVDQLRRWTRRGGSGDRSAA